MELKKCHPTFIRKDTRGNWKAEDTYEVRDNIKLRVSTSKNFSGEYTTTASCHKLEGGFETHAVYQDYIRTLARSRIRGTSKNVETQHASVADQLPQVFVAVVAHYSKE
jgi:hypothetical protein